MSEFTNKNIWVFIETDEGKTKSVGLELLNPGRMLAEKSGEKLVAVVFGKDNAEAIEQIKGYGPDQIISVSGGEYEKYSFDAYTYAMTSLVEKYQPSAILIGATNNGRDFAPRLSCRLRTGLTADCTSLDYDAESGNVAWTRPAFGGNLMAVIMCPNTRPQIGTVRPGVFKKTPVEGKEMEVCVKYAQERTTMGKPIYKNQAISSKIADMEIAIETSRAIGMKVAALLDAGDPLAATLGPIAKCYCSDALNRVTTEAVQILGGYGYMRDYPVEKLMRDAKIFQIFEGTNEIQRVVISGNVIRKNKIK